MLSPTRDPCVRGAKTNRRFRKEAAENADAGVFSLFGCCRFTRRMAESEQDVAELTETPAVHPGPSSRPATASSRPATAGARASVQQSSQQQQQPRSRPGTAASQNAQQELNPLPATSQSRASGSIVGVASPAELESVEVVDDDANANNKQSASEAVEAVNASEPLLTEANIDANVEQAPARPATAASQRDVPPPSQPQTNQASRPNTAAAGRPKTAGTRPTTAVATRPTTASNRPATAGARPTTGKRSEPVLGESLPDQATEASLVVGDSGSKAEPRLGTRPPSARAPPQADPEPVFSDVLYAPKFTAIDDIFAKIDADISQQADFKTDDKIGNAMLCYACRHHSLAHGHSTDPPAH